MDWNKISTILITAFIILNVFLFVSSKDILNAGFGPENDPEFPQEVANLLKVQNITINTEIPGETYVLPVLETEYEIINIDSKLLQNFLNEKIDPIEDVYKYTNSKGESLEIRDGKKLILILRKKVNEKFDRKDIREEISRFLEQKNIDADGYVENLVHISENEAIYRYTLRYNDYPLDNS
ncbi:MAG: hypothetical protein KBI20_02900, partial [Sedimentibacter sp.]|nr:hypothetical protein [Sedimentibacter sp.]